MTQQRKRIEVGDGELVLHNELADVLGVTRQHAGRLAARSSFPKPIIRTIGGASIWRVRDVRVWNEPRRPGRPTTTPKK